MKEYILGCNYWASHAGTEMWVNWDSKAVKSDMKLLSENGVRYLRVFPNWRDFQPIKPMMEGMGYISEYRLVGDKFPENPYFLDEVMLGRFAEFCDICAEYGMKLIVGLLTGWMSGRLFIPSALYGKNLYTDATALLFEQRFIRGFVSKFKDKDVVYAWDLGNECNGLSPCDNRFIADNWTALVANAIRACDNTRPVISGMHSLGVDYSISVWSIKGQAEYNDILTTHPYPFWVGHASKDTVGSYRTAMHATCETKLYGDVGHKPCFAEEIGTMGPMVCSDKVAADFLRCNLFSQWANGSIGTMWWCANEQTNLNTAPYTSNMCEVELGMIDAERRPKPVLNEMKRFAEFLAEFKVDLPKAKTDAVCILTQTQDHWGVAYMTYCLAKQAGLNLEFAYCDDEIPESEIYMLPSLNGNKIMPKENYTKLLGRVQKGSTLYLSNDAAILSEFSRLTGLEVIDSASVNDNGSVDFFGENIEFSRIKRYFLSPCGAHVLAYDNFGIPAITEYKYGEGKVYYINFPLESMLLSESHTFDNNRFKVYKKLFETAVSNHTVTTDNEFISVTEHKAEDTLYCVAVNYSSVTQKPQFVVKGVVEDVVYGCMDEILPFDAVVFKVKH